MSTLTPRTYASTIEALRFGTLGVELTDKMRDLIAKCADTQRNGSITLTLQLKPGKGGQIEVFDAIVVKMPKEEKGSTLMFATPENNLQREDPRQMQLEGLRTVDKETGELRELKQGT